MSWCHEPHYLLAHWHLHGCLGASAGAFAPGLHQVRCAVLCCLHARCPCPTMSRCPEPCCLLACWHLHGRLGASAGAFAPGLHQVRCAALCCAVCTRGPSSAALCACAVPERRRLQGRAGIAPRACAMALHRVRCAHACCPELRCQSMRCAERGCSICTVPCLSAGMLPAALMCFWDVCCMHGAAWLGASAAVERHRPLRAPGF